MPRKTPKRERAGLTLNRGLEAQERGDWDAALALYREAAAIDATYFGPPLNIGLIHKWRSEWQPALDALARAFELVGDHRDRATVAWNLGIVASAVGDWDRAFAAWRALDMPIERGSDGTPSLPIGRTPIRLGPNDGDEIVWADRFDPVRARIESTPSAASGYRVGDVVVHDAEPLGKFEGTDLSIFRALVRIAAR